MSNIVTGNMSNESFGEKKLELAIWRKIDLAGIVSKRTDDSAVLFSLKYGESCTRTTNLEDFIAHHKGSLGTSKFFCYFFAKAFFAPNPQKKSNSMFWSSI